MKRQLRVAKGILLGIVAWTVMIPPTTGLAQDDNSVKQDAKDAGHSAKQTAKKTGKTIKKGTKKAVNKSAQKTKQGAAKVEDKTKP